MKKKQPIGLRGLLCGMATALLGGSLHGYTPDPITSGIAGSIDVAPVWSAHRTGPPQLLTHEGHQYVAFYDSDRFLTLAQRKLASEEWTYHRFPVQMGWQTGSHAQLSIALDRKGYIHVACYRRGLLQEPPMPPRPIYFRSLAPHSVDAFEQLYMVSASERTDYPTFITVDNTLFFSFRDGGSGRGDQHFYRYDVDRRRWERLLESPLLDGRSVMNAYVFGGGFPVFGPDNRWHLLWMWRNTPDHATNHSLSYARTIGDDLTQWESAAGDPVSPPFTIDHTGLLVDDAPPGGGLSNPLKALSWDSKQRVIVSYHRFDESGKSQIYNARFEDGNWRIVPATEWDFVWGESYFGTGALNIAGTIRFTPVSQAGYGKLAQQVWNRDIEERVVLLDEESLQPIGQEVPPVVPWRQSLSIPESDFRVEPIPELRRTGGTMQVELIPDSGRSGVEGLTYYLRWEHAGANRDQPVPEPWPPPTILRVYKISDEPGAALAD